MCVHEARHFHALGLSFLKESPTGFSKLGRNQGCGSGSGAELDPDSIGSVDPEIRIRIQEGKNDPQKYERLRIFML
jgi:hypothetical protein